MRITRLESRLLRLPLDPPITAPQAADPFGRLDHVFMLIVHLDTDADLRGLGFAYALQGGGRALKAIADDDLAPLVVGEDPLDHERLGARVYWRLQSIGRRGLVQQAYAAVDLALWDLKGKAAGLPLYKLLGGARESAPVYGSDTGWLWMSADEIIKSAGRYLEQGMAGIKVKVGNPDPDVDAERLTRVREALGEEIWLGVDANQRYDFGTALAMGHFFEEDIGADWFEEPLCCEDLEGHARLAAKLEVPIALGETLFGLDEFQRYLERGAVDILQPDVTRVGGLTAWLKVAAVADLHYRPLAPHLLPEVAVHLACGLPRVTLVEYMPWLYPAYVEPPAIVKGQMVPPPRPGLGLEIDPAAVRKYAVPC
ncbi:MAG TPA: mandelate racemase/muconate lactonizing enzyme family protein [Gemmataceae bacterium]|nr:mandelate racemase/muconate lactonizing enzyme family protein [Gemmataceae bacterium]